MGCGSTRNSVPEPGRTSRSSPTSATLATRKDRTLPASRRNENPRFPPRYGWEFLQSEPFPRLFRSSCPTIRELFLLKTGQGVYKKIKRAYIPWQRSRQRVLLSGTSRRTTVPVLYAVGRRPAALSPTIQTYGGVVCGEMFHFQKEENRNENSSYP